MELSSTARHRKGLVHLDDDGVGLNAVPLDRVRSAVWGMLYADDASIISRSAYGLAKMTTVNVNVFKAAGITVSEKKTESIRLRTPTQTLITCCWSWKQQAMGINRQWSFCTWAVLSTRQPTLCHFFSFLTLLLSSFWTSRGHRCRPFSPPVLAFNFYRA